jgi:toxin secretion/phage lysis holin
MNAWQWVKSVFAVVVAAVGALWGGLPLMVHLLIWLMVGDIVTGLIAGFVAKKLSSDVSWRGMSKKAIVLILVAGAEYAGPFVSIPQLGAGVAGFYCLHEALSVLENAVNAGVPIPDFLRDALAKLSPAKMGEE